MITRNLKRWFCLIAIVLTFLVGWQASARNAQTGSDDRTLPPVPTSPFAPSNALTANGQLIPVEQFFSASRCLTCHHDTHAAWSHSLHRNAAREPFYRESADILLRTRGIEFTRHCEACHTPVALFSGALNKDAPKQSAPFTKLDDEGVTCSVCHSVTEARLDGTGSYTIHRPALLAKEDGTPVFSINGGDITDEQILADVPGHKRAVMNATLRTPEFCATCHKVDAPPTLNGYKHIRGFSAYDEWQQSGASQESVLPFYQRDMRKDCRACHMPKVESLNDRSAKDGKIASHRWLGANTAAPLFYGQTKQVALTAEFLQKDVLEVDIFALRRNVTGELIAPLETTSQLELKPGEEITAEVVVSNRNAAHSFPPEVRDLYEAWVEFEVLDGTGTRVFHSGFIRPDGMLDEAAHSYKQLILDEQGRQITRHQIWTTNIRAYDNAIQAGRSDVVRFRFRVPALQSNPKRKGLTLRARVNYRRFNQEYTKYVLAQQSKKMTVPIVQMAEARLHVTAASSTTQSAVASLPSSMSTPHWKRWNDYGIGLLEQSQYGDAAAAFRRAAELSPADPNLLVNAALAELRTERYAHQESPQLDKAAKLLARALQLPVTGGASAPAQLRARFYRALVWRAAGKPQEAAAEFAQIAEAFPRDREVQRQLAQTQYTLGKLTEARTIFEAILGIDPTDFAAYQFLAPLYLSAGRKDEAERADKLYLLWRDDPRADGVAAKFFAAHPEWADERVGSHVHVTSAPGRPVLTGQAAGPEK